MNEPKGILFNIQRISVHDGPGIRTTIFFKGCSNRCIWCHNPESLSFHPQLMFSAEKCQLCGKCENACPRHAHSFQRNSHVIDRKKCTWCGKCVDVCSYSALEMVGRIYTVSEVMGVVKRDVLFYGKTGGVTFSGGEPLAQPDFAQALAAEIFNAKMDLCIETGGAVSWEAYEKVIPYVSMFLYDIKETDSKRLKQYTGICLATVEDNLKRLTAQGKQIILRCPVIPGINDREEHFRSIAKLSQTDACIREIHLEPYHPMGIGKAIKLGKQQAYFNKEFLLADSVTQWKTLIEALTSIPVKII